MISSTVILFSVLFASTNAFWWSGPSRPLEDDGKESPNIEPIPVGYLRFYTYHPVVPMAASRSYMPYQNNPIGWIHRSAVPSDNKHKVVSKYHTFQPAIAPPPAQSPPPAIASQLASVEEPAVTKIVPTTTTVVTTTTVAPVSSSIAPIESTSTNNDVPISRNDIGEAPPQPAAYSARETLANSVAPSPVHITLPQYSQPLPDPSTLPYMPAYQNPHVQYMPCMCPVNVATSDVVQQKQIESREDTFDVDMSSDFQ